MVAATLADIAPEAVMSIRIFSHWNTDAAIRYPCSFLVFFSEIQDTFGKIITEPEIKAFEAVAKHYFKQTRQRYLPEYWVPLQWAVRLSQKAGLHGNIPDPRMIGYMFRVRPHFCSLPLPFSFDSSERLHPLSVGREWNAEVL